MKRILFILAACTSLAASAQTLGRQPQVLESLAGPSQYVGRTPFAVEGLKRRMDAALFQRHKADQSLFSGQGPIRKASLKEVAPMLTTRWAQDSPYNRLLPSGGGFWGSTYQTGCVATAMAQILNYYEYPKASIGQGSYSTDGGSSYRSAKTQTTFSWDLMADQYMSGATEAQAKAVGELMRDCGYASNMIYTTQGSGTTAYDAGYGLAHNMQYDSLSLRVYNRLFHSDDQWKEIIYSELQAGRPVLYDAVDPSINMGHAFVFDGMDKDGLVHVNWGWSGNANGYFDLDRLAPSYSDMYGQQYSYNFSTEHKMITGFRPSAAPAANEHYQSFFAMQEEEKMWIEDDHVIVQTNPIFNFTHLCFSGLLGLVVENAQTGRGVVLPFYYTPWEQGIEIPYLGGLYAGDESGFDPRATLNDTDGKTPRPDGQYLLYLISWSTQEMKADLAPQYIRMPAKYVGENEENFGVWEAEIRDGHWVSESVKRYPIQKKETAIRDVTRPATDADAIYNLQGQRLPARQKGINLIGGRRVLVR